MIEIIEPANKEREFEFPCYAKSNLSKRVVMFFNPTEAVEILDAKGDPVKALDSGGWCHITEDCWEVFPKGTVIKFTQP